MARRGVEWKMSLSHSSVGEEPFKCWPTVNGLFISPGGTPQHWPPHVVYGHYVGDPAWSVGALLLSLRALLVRVCSERLCYIRQIRGRDKLVQRKR